MPDFLEVVGPPVDVEGAGSSPAAELPELELLDEELRLDDDDDDLELSDEDEPRLSLDRPRPSSGSLW